MHLRYAALSSLSRCLPVSQPLHSLTPVRGYLSVVLLMYVIGYVAVTGQTSLSLVEEQPASSLAHVSGYIPAENTSYAVLPIVGWCALVPQLV